MGVWWARDFLIYSLFILISHLLCCLFVIYHYWSTDAGFGFEIWDFVFGGKGGGSGI